MSGLDSGGIVCDDGLEARGTAGDLQGGGPVPRLKEAGGLAAQDGKLEVDEGLLAHAAVVVVFVDVVVVVLGFFVVGLLHRARGTRLASFAVFGVFAGGHAVGVLDDLLVAPQSPGKSEAINRRIKSEVDCKCVKPFVAVHGMCLYFRSLLNGAGSLRWRMAWPEHDHLGFSFSYNHRR